MSAVKKKLIEMYKEGKYRRKNQGKASLEWIMRPLRMAVSGAARQTESGALQKISCLPTASSIEAW